MVFTTQTTAHANPHRRRSLNRTTALDRLHAAHDAQDSYNSYKLIFTDWTNRLHRPHVIHGLNVAQEKMVKAHNSNGMHVIHVDAVKALNSNGVHVDAVKAHNSNGMYVIDDFDAGRRSLNGAASIHARFLSSCWCINQRRGRLPQSRALPTQLHQRHSQQNVARPTQLHHSQQGDAFPTRFHQPSDQQGEASLKQLHNRQDQHGNALLEVVFALALFALIAVGMAQTTLALLVAARSYNSRLLARTTQEALLAAINSRERARYDLPNDPPQPPFDLLVDPLNPDRAVPAVVNNQTTLRLNACPAACRVVYQIVDPTSNSVQYITRTWTAPPPQGATPRLLIAYRIDDLLDADGRWRGRTRRTAAVWDFPQNLSPGSANGTVSLPPPRDVRSITSVVPR